MSQRRVSLILFTIVLGVLQPKQAASSSVASPLIASVELSGGKPGIGFDDLQWSADIGRVIVPGGRSGNIYLIDPDSLAVTAIGGFSVAASFEGGHDFGVTSAADAEGFLYATDRTAGQLVQIDLKTKARLNVRPLRGHPDYVRYVANTRELWVTEPGSAHIEVVALGHNRPPSLTSITLLSVRGGPESLVIDAGHKRAYTNSFAGSTFAIDVSTREIVNQRRNGCVRSLGIAIDVERQRIFVGCAVGEITEFAAIGGELISRRTVGPSIDIIAYDAIHQRVVAASSAKHQLDVVKVSTGGELDTEYAVPLASTASCVVTDAKGRAWVCDPSHGRVLRVTLPNGT
ncbi:MAG TPA: hypothetical protein VGI70_09805 [Polyangiales bacterium]